MIDDCGSSPSRWSIKHPATTSNDSSRGDGRCRSKIVLGQQTRTHQSSPRAVDESSTSGLCLTRWERSNPTVRCITARSPRDRIDLDRLWSIEGCSLSSTLSLSLSRILLHYLATSIWSHSFWCWFDELIDQKGFLGVGGKTPIEVARDRETRDMILHRGSISHSPTMQISVSFDDHHHWHSLILEWLLDDSCVCVCVCACVYDCGSTQNQWSSWSSIDLKHDDQEPMFDWEYHLDQQWEISNHRSPSRSVSSQTNNISSSTIKLSLIDPTRDYHLLASRISRWYWLKIEVRFDWDFISSIAALAIQQINLIDQDRAMAKHWRLGDWLGLGFEQ